MRMRASWLWVFAALLVLGVSAQNESSVAAMMDQVRASSREGLRLA